MFVDTRDGDVEELCARLALVVQWMLLRTIERKMNVSLLCDVQRIRRRLHHPRIGDDQPSPVRAGRKLIDTTELDIDGRHHRLPGAVIWCVRLEKPGYRMVRPLATGPVESDDGGTARKEKTRDDEELPVERGCR